MAVEKVSIDEHHRIILRIRWKESLGDFSRYGTIVVADRVGRHEVKMASAPPRMDDVVVDVSPTHVRWGWPKEGRDPLMWEWVPKKG